MADIVGRQNADCGLDSEEGSIVGRAGCVPAVWRTDRTVCFSLSRDVYSLKAILAAAYKFTDRWTVLVDADGDGRWVVFLAGPDGMSLDPAAAAFANELADQQLRALLELEFGALRTLVVAQAFSEGNLLDPDRGTLDDKADPRGTGLRR